MKPLPFLLLLVIIISTLCPSTKALQSVALLTGATGRTGQLVTTKLLNQGFLVRIFCRDEEKARQTFGLNPNIEFCCGDLSSTQDIEEAFKSKKQLTHVVFMAGGEGADYNIVNFLGLKAFAEKAELCDSIKHFVVISSAWATRPYSIAGLLFNSMYQDTVPMASHYLGEQALRSAACKTNGRLNYMILRAGGLNEDDRYAKKYPDAYAKGLTYQQGDNFDFLGIAGRPGMCRSQLADAVVSCINVQGRYTFEVTGSGNFERTDSSFYKSFEEDKVLIASLGSNRHEEIITAMHTQAVGQLKTMAFAASAGSIALVAHYGWLQGICFVLTMDAIILMIWSVFLTKQQAL